MENISEDTILKFAVHDSSDDRSEKEDLDAVPKLSPAEDRNLACSTVDESRRDDKQSIQFKDILVNRKELTRTVRIPEENVQLDVDPVEVRIPEEDVQLDVDPVVVRIPEEDVQFDIDPVVAMGKKQSSTRCNLGYLCQPTGIVKIVCICLILFALTLQLVEREGYNNLGAYYVCLSVTPTLVLCYVLSQMGLQRTVFEPIMNLLMALFCFLHVIPIFAVDDWTARTVVAAVFVLVAAVGYAADFVMAVIGYTRA